MWRQCPQLKMMNVSFPSPASWNVAAHNVQPPQQIQKGASERGWGLAVACCAGASWLFLSKCALSIDLEAVSNFQITGVKQTLVRHVLCLHHCLVLMWGWTSKGNSQCWLEFQLDLELEASQILQKWNFGPCWEDQDMQEQGTCNAWTEQVCEPHLNNTHTHLNLNTLLPTCTCMVLWVQGSQWY